VLPGQRDVIIYRNEHAYCAWPDIKMLSADEWVVAFCEAMRRPEVTHQDPTAHNVLIRSTDGGETWDRYPLVVPSYDFWGMDDPGLTLLSNGDLVLSAYRHAYRSREEVDRENLRQYRPVGSFPWAQAYNGTFVHRSEDGGRTWPHTSRVDVSPFDCGCTLRPMVELPTRELLLACYDETRNPCPSFVVRSEDKGTTWGTATIVAEDEEIGFFEPAIHRLADGRIIALLRTHEPGGYFLYQCESEDDGHTWTRPRQTPIWGYPAHILTLRDGRVLCTYGYRRNPFGIRACLSADGGLTWDIEHELVIRADFPDGDLGYPTAVQLEDGTVFVVYYGKERGVTCIQGSYIRV